jgi:CheY-like chemotaxis protein
MSQRARILVVEDDPSIADVLEMALTDEGFEVVHVADGAAALAEAMRTPPTLILLDMRMPVMDGPQFAAAYRQSPPPHAPIVVLTASRDAVSAAEEVEADGVLAKPFDLDDLLALIDEQLTQD